MLAAQPSPFLCNGALQGVGSLRRGLNIYTTAALPVGEALEEPCTETF